MIELVDVLLQQRYTLVDIMGAVMLALLPGIQIVDVFMQLVSAKTGVHVEQPEPAEVSTDGKTEGDGDENSGNGDE